jgi:hypothetical protein
LTRRVFGLVVVAGDPSLLSIADPSPLIVLSIAENLQIHAHVTHSSVKMAPEQVTVVPTKEELDHFQLNNRDTITLIQKAQASDAADRELTIPQAFLKYKKAVIWSCLLSTALIMEGYDVVIVRDRGPHLFHPS